MKRFILILVTTVQTTFLTILQKLFILRFIITLLLVCPRTCSIYILSSYQNDYIIKWQQVLVYLLCTCESSQHNVGKFSMI